MKLYINKTLFLAITLMMSPLAVFSTEEKLDAPVLVQGSVGASSALNADPMSGGYLLQLIIGLFIVLICIVALAWFAKKINRFQSITDDSLKVIAALSMGAREKVILLQVGEDQLLIGVSPGRINRLHVLETPIETTDNRSDESLGHSFSNKLKTMMADASKNQLDKTQLDNKPLNKKQPNKKQPNKNQGEQ